MKQPLFQEHPSVRTDNCARMTKDSQNDRNFSFQVNNYLPVDCVSPHMRSPDVQYDHPNLRAKIGYGLTDDCLVDIYSGLRNAPEQLTRDRCRVQLFTRIFQGVPNLRPGMPNSDKEMPLLQGTPGSIGEGTSLPCKKTLAEVDYNRFVPLVDCLKNEVQKPDNIIPPWVNGGVMTRDFVRRQEWNKACGMQFDARNNN